MTNLKLLQEEKKRRRERLVCRFFQVVGGIMFVVGMSFILLMALPKSIRFMSRVLSLIDPLLLLEVCFLLVCGLWLLMIDWQLEKELEAIVS